jgi:DNA-binding transcriptional LysR family regulator
MDPRRLLTFRVVAHERSFSRAAEKLSLSQPSVSHQVALLETEIGLRLLDRGRGGLRLTRVGDVLLEHADHVAWRLQMADTQISALAQERRDQVRLGAFPTALTGLVPAAIGRLRSTNNDLQVLLSEVTPSRLEPRFLAGEFDLAVSYQDAEADRRELEGAERVDLLQETFFVGMPPTHRLANATGPVALAAFADDDWIVPSREGFLVQACHDAGFTPQIVSITQDPIATRGLISRGIGVGWVPSLLSDDFEEAVMRPIDGPMRRRDIYALLPPGDRHPLAADMLHALVETAGEFPAEA